MKILFLVLLCAISTTVLSQETVIINFKTKEVTLPSKKSLRKNSLVKLKFVDLPTSNYIVSINKTDSVVNPGVPPGLFSVFSFGDGFNSLLAGLTSYSVPTVPSLSQTDIQSLIKAHEDRFNMMEDATSNPLSKAVSLSHLIKKMRKYVFDFHYCFRDSVIKKADKLLYIVGMGELTDATQFRERAEKIIEARLKKDKELEEKYVSYYNEILELGNYELVRSLAGLKAGDSMLTAYKRNFDLFLNKFDTTFNEELIIKIYRQLSAPVPSNEYLSFPYKLNGDISRFAINITGIDPTKTPQSYSTIIELNRYPNRLWAFTSGVFVSGLKNDEFAIHTHVLPRAGNTSTPDSLNYSIQQENNKGVSAGINALIHLGSYFNDNSETGGFVAFGPGLTLEKNPQVRVMLGAGLVFGRNNKLALTFGWAGGPVKRLSGNYNTEDRYHPAPTDITRDRFKGSWFASLGYGLFGK